MNNKSINYDIDYRKEGTSMPQVKPRVELLRHTYQAEEMVAMAAKLCYSSADIETLKAGIQKKDQSPFINKLMEMGHHSLWSMSVSRLASTASLRAFLAQVTRHRLRLSRSSPNGM